MCVNPEVHTQICTEPERGAKLCTEVQIIRDQTKNCVTCYIVTWIIFHLKQEVYRERGAGFLWLYSVFSCQERS